MKIGFYLQNKGIPNIDLSNPEGGNPGIGGTQFMIWSLGHYLKKNFPSLDIYFFVDEESKFPNEINIAKVIDIVDAANKASELEIDIFIFRSVEDTLLYHTIDRLKLNSIAWGHNFGSAKELRQISQSTFLKRYVCVGKQQYEMLKDHGVFKKSTYIYNGIDTSLYKKSIQKDKENIICYIGSIIPSKGFHILARNWGAIKKQVPDVKLYVIGSGSLYNRNQKLGRYNVAESSYEQKFMKYLIDDTDKIQNDVKFFGVLNNNEKIEVINQSKVGIVNPSAKTETFGISAIEFEVLDVPVVTKRKNGFIDTIVSGKTGMLIKNENQFSDTIVELLNNNTLNKELSRNGQSFIIENFDVNKIVKEWNILFNQIISGEVDNKELDKGNLFTSDNFMWLREVNRNIKRIKILENIPSIHDYPYLIKGMVKFILNKN